MNFDKFSFVKHEWSSFTTTVVRRIYENDLRIAAEFDDSGAVLKEYVYGTSVNAPEYVIVGGVKYKYVRDHLGSVRLLVKASDGTIAQRMDYNENGHVVYNSNPGFQAYGFAGGIYDEALNLVKFGARWYNPVTARWTTKDPIRFDGGNTNLFGYVENDPINRFDAKGLWSITVSLFAGAGGSLSVGADNSTNRPFVNLRFGYGLGGGISFDQNGSPPVPQCPQRGPNVSIGIYGEVSANNGPHEAGVSAAGGVSSKKGTPYYLNANPPAGTVGDSTGVAGSISAGVELSFF